MTRGKHLTYEEKKIINEFLKDGRSITEISRKIDRPLPTIHLEIKRNGGRIIYSAEESHQKYRAAKNVKNKHPENKIQTQLMRIQKSIQQIKEILNDSKNK